MHIDVGNGLIREYAHIWLHDQTKTYFNTGYLFAYKPCCFIQADIDLSKRAGELSEEEVDKIVTIMQNPRQYKIPDWFLNRQKDIKDGK